MNTLTSSCGISPLSHILPNEPLEDRAAAPRRTQQARTAAAPKTEPKKEIMKNQTIVIDTQETETMEVGSALHWVELILWCLFWIARHLA
ncbi:hypothetical protein SNOG_03403 [Parastagonospora nodorum SN15]|uniref:Uncharacterized protein n=1 Tax=Phaeosphaeria nodorum (strain SN15 / ATCC MYA-4574 / FGSC 10173) TaxID=321614 RepID=Q0UXW1_PHANO|nr:hypothetical protein SNOG_03403 [Parastagonospora nodorum SN15]EAT88608.1 hypothetical protein SNOG_03403 [Parastagonospora nodorum SN15]